MIKRAQIQFICVTMSILFAVFGVLFIGIQIITKNLHERGIERTLEDTENNFIMHNHTTENGIVAVIVRLPNGSLSFDYSYDGNVFSKEDVQSYIANALRRPYSNGNDYNVYYKLKVQSDNSFLYVASDMSEAISAYRSTILNGFFILLCVYLILFYIVFRLSFRIFRPIVNSFLQQKQFISNASHELKTPLSVISANADVLKQSGDNKWLNNIQNQTERMNLLVADMLTLAKFDEGKLKLAQTEFNLSQEIIESTLPFDAVAFEKGKTIETSIPENVYMVGDIQSVKKIVNILLDNAVKHADDKGKIKVSLKKESGKIALSVFNTGSFIPSADSNKIFERFYRGDNSRSRESGGSGLGLAIAKSVADLNKWKISAKSIEGVSMTVTVIFK